MKSLFDENAFAEINSRLENLTPETQRQWGKMDVAQMLKHTTFPLEIVLGKKQVKKPNFVLRLILSSFKKSMYNDKPWKQGLQTGKELVVSSPQDFQKEKESLKKLVNEFYEKGASYNWADHPMFGKFTSEQWGKMQYKHLDHHFRQFGV